MAGSETTEIPEYRYDDAKNYDITNRVSLIFMGCVNFRARGCNITRVHVFMATYQSLRFSVLLLPNWPQATCLQAWVRKENYVETIIIFFAHEVMSSLWDKDFTDGITFSKQIFLHKTFPHVFFELFLDISGWQSDFGRLQSAQLATR